MTYKEKEYEQQISDLTRRLELAMDKITEHENTISKLEYGFNQAVYELDKAKADRDRAESERDQARKELEEAKKVLKEINGLRGWPMDNHGNEMHRVLSSEFLSRPAPSMKQDETKEDGNG